jgi:iron-regulated transporter 1
MVPGLRRSSEPISNSREVELADFQTEFPRDAPPAPRMKSALHKIFPISSLPHYFRHRAFLPSFSLSLLYLTVLSFSGQMITFLISIGYNSLHVGIARTVSTIFELSATWIAPRMVKRVGAVRGGIWSLCWQMVWLAAGVSWLFGHLDASPLISGTGLAVAVALSRVGLWGFDLCAQNIVQDVSLPTHETGSPLHISMMLISF